MCKKFYVIYSVFVTMFCSVFLTGCMTKSVPNEYTLTTPNGSEIYQVVVVASSIQKSVNIEHITQTTLLEGIEVKVVVKFAQSYANDYDLQTAEFYLNNTQVFGVYAYSQMYNDYVFEVPIENSLSQNHVFAINLDNIAPKQL